MLEGFDDSGDTLMQIGTTDGKTVGLAVDVDEGAYVHPAARAFYFSVVTMTTLGFRDITAARGSYLGHALLTIQVVLGYVMLGALVTRFAVLFIAGGPASNHLMKKMPKDVAERVRMLRKRWPEWND